MKYIILILLTAFSFSAKSQNIYTPMTAGGYQMKYVKVDSGFALPFRDTTIGRGVDRPGLMVVNPQDSLPYYYSGSRWKPVYVDSSGVIEMINGKIDSITVNGNNIFYWVAGLGYGQQLNKLDSIHVSSDSIFTCIAGNCTFQYLTTAGTGTVTQIISGFGLLPDTITASGTLAVDTSVFHTSNWNNAAYAAISHTHSASDIISGTLPIVRGGTGLSGIGAVGQELRVASSGTALEYFTPNYASQTYVDSLNSVKSLSGSYYGIISGGIVTYSGTGYTYYVSACKYMIGGVVYNSRDTSITLTAADATDPRIDLFAVDTLNRVVKITGTAAATPLTPQVDPASQIALTTGITLPPTSTTPTGTSSTLIYDENTEWTTGGTATVDFNNTAQPYHGTKDAYVSAYSKNSNLTFTNGSTVTVSGQILRLFIRLNNSNYSFQVQFFNGSTAVSSIITAPVNNSLFGSYQNISIPLSSFSWSSAAFNKLAVTMTGKGGTGTYYLDYVSLESGTPTITPPTDYSNKLDSVYLRNDSLFQYVKGVETFKGKTTGSGGTTTNSVTFNNSGTGDASGTTFNGSVARTISSNTIGAVAKADSTTAYVTPTQLANNHINLYKPLYGVASDSSIHVYTETDTTLNDNSDTTVPTTKAVKAYVNNHAGGGGSGSVTSISQGYGIVNTPNPIVSTGTVTVDSSALSGYYVRRKDSTVSFVTPYQSSLKQDKITLTTTGTSGAATLTGGTLNIPQYSGGTTLNGTGYVQMAGTTPSYVTSPIDSAAYHTASLFSDTTLILKRPNGINDSVSFHIGIPANGWLLNGNAGTRSDSNFIGTTDTANLTFKVHNVLSGRIDSINATNGKALFGFGAAPLATENDATAFGFKALNSLTTGGFPTYYGNTAIGTKALSSITTTGYNTAVGYNAAKLSTGTANTALGFNALTSGVTVSNNTAIGTSAMTGQLSSNNVAVGYTTMGSGSGTGGSNTAVGTAALGSSTINGSLNSAFGYGAGGLNGSGANNLYLGQYAGYNNTTSNQIFISSMGNRGSYINDQTGSPIYITQSGLSTYQAPNQSITLNGKVGNNIVSPTAWWSLSRGDGVTAPLSFQAPLTLTSTSGTSNSTNFTINFATQASYPFAMGTWVTLSGFTPSAYNGTWLISSETTSSIGISSALNPGTVTVNGTITQGALKATPVNGEAEYDGVDYYVTTSNGTRYKLTRTLTGTAAPTITPASVGVQFVDTVNKKIYVSTGTSSSADWTILN